MVRETFSGKKERAGLHYLPKGKPLRINTFVGVKGPFAGFSYVKFIYAVEIIFVSTLFI